MLRLDRVRLEEDEDEDEDDGASAKVIRARKKRKAREEQNHAILLDAAAYLARATCWHNRLEAERPKPGSRAQRWACICGALSPLPTRCDIRRVTCSSSASSVILRPPVSHRPEELAEPLEPAECVPPFRVLPSCCESPTQANEPRPQAACSSTITQLVSPACTGVKRRKLTPAPVHAIDCTYESPTRCETGASCRSLETSVHPGKKVGDPRACATCLPVPKPPVPVPKPPSVLSTLSQRPALPGPPAPRPPPPRPPAHASALPVSPLVPRVPVTPPSPKKWVVPVPNLSEMIKRVS